MTTPLPGIAWTGGGVDDLTAMVVADRAAGVVLTSDSFNRPDTAAGVLNTTDAAAGGLPGFAWTAPDFQIVSNQVKRNGGTGGNQNAIIDVGSGEVRVLIQVGTMPTGANLVGPLARMSGTTYYQARVAVTGEVELIRVNAGVATSLGVTSGLGFTAGGVLGIIAKGDQIRATRNGTTVLTATDASIPVGTVVGFRSTNSTVPRLDAFLVAQV